MPLVFIEEKPEEVHDSISLHEFGRIIGSLHFRKSPRSHRIPSVNKVIPKYMHEIVLLILSGLFSVFLHLKYSNLPCFTIKSWLCVFWVIPSAHYSLTTIILKKKTRLQFTCFSWCGFLSSRRLYVKDERV